MYRNVYTLPIMGAVKVPWNLRVTPLRAFSLKYCIRNYTVARRPVSLLLSFSCPLLKEQFKQGKKKKEGKYHRRLPDVFIQARLTLGLNAL